MKRLLQLWLPAGFLSVVLLSLSIPARAANAPADVAGKMLRDASLMLLKEGNERFVAGKPQHPNLDSERRASTVSGGQEPFATILSCSDSRGPVELLFDRGVGDLFVIRVAGNIAGESELATMEYGVGHLNTPVLVVMGHSKCGAVTAVTKGAELHGHLHSLGELIEPAAQKARAEATGADDLIPRAIQANVWNTLERILRESSVIREKARAGTVHLVGAVYDLESGRVSWLGSHPAQEAIIVLANQAVTDAALAQTKESFAPGSSKKPGTAAPAHGESKAAPPSGSGTHGAVAGGTAPKRTGREVAQEKDGHRDAGNSETVKRLKPTRGLAGGSDPNHEPAPDPVPAKEHVTPGHDH